MTDGDLAYRQALRYAEELRDLYRRDRAGARRLRDVQRAGAAVRRVMSEGRISVLFQPIVDLRVGAVVGAEALSRFPSDPTRAPDRWFADAEVAGLRTELELFAIRAAVARADDIPGQIYLSLNVSPSSVGADLCRAISPFPLDRVVIEVTEHARVADYNALRSDLEALRAGGGRLAVDDAGAGFASLRHIVRLEPDVIKIDMSITRGIDRDRRKRAVARGLTSFATEIGTAVVAEGVETDDEIAALRELGVAYGQGYRLGRPAAAVALGAPD